MLVECRKCGAPLAVKRKARRTKCRYCGSVDERERMKAIAEETPEDFRPPKHWTPPADKEVEAGKPLPYREPVSAFAAWGAAVVIMAVVVGIPILWESNLWNTRPEALLHASPIGKRAEVAKALGGKVASPTMIVVPLRSDRYEELELRYANASDDVPRRIALEVRHGKNADEGAHDLLSSRLNGGLDKGNWHWGPVHMATSTGGIAAEVDSDASDPLRRRRVQAAWSLVLGAAFDPTVSPAATELRDVMGAGYPVAMLSTISPLLPLEQVKATIATAFPGALIEAKIQMNANIPLDHPFVRAVVLSWFVMPGGTLADVRFESKPALGASVDAFAHCLTPALGPPHTTIVNPIEGTKSYTFHPGNAQVDVSSTLSMSASGLHGVPATVDVETWKKLVSAIAGCGR